MLLNVEDDNLIRHYLLGELQRQPELLEQVEQRLLAEDDFIAHCDVIEAELIEAYVGGRLSAAERTAFEQHFSLTAQRREQLSLTMALQHYATQDASEFVRPPEPTPSRWWRWDTVVAHRWQVVAGVLLAFAVGAGIWRAYVVPSAVDQGLSQLFQAFQHERPIEARITGLPYAPFVVRRGAGDSTPQLSLEEAEVLLRRAARESGGVAEVRGLGLLYLAKKEFASAVSQFEQALQQQPRDARLHCELGTALLEKSRVSKRNGDTQSEALEVSRALEEFNQALRLNAVLPEALFNRALCRQWIGLDEQAIAGWREYLQQDPKSPWAEEARKNLTSLEDKLKNIALLKASLFEGFTTAFSQQDATQAWHHFQLGRSRHGNSITERLLNEYLSRSAVGQTTDALIRLVFAGDLERRQVNDHFTYDLAKYYRERASANLNLLRQAHDALRTAQLDHNSQPPKIESAMSGFLAAREYFLKAGSEGEALLADSRANYCRNRLGETEAATHNFLRLVEVYRRKNYQSLLAYAWLGLADAYTGRDDFSRSVNAAQVALPIARAIGDDWCALRGASALGALYLELGRYDESLSVSLQGIRLASQLPADPKETWGLFSVTPRGLLALDWKLAALEIQQAATQQAVQSGWPLYQSLSYSRLGVINASLGRYQDALRLGDLSVATASQITDSASRENALADARFYQGELRNQARLTDEALDAYQQALAAYAHKPFQLYAYKAWQGSFLAHLTQNRQREAEADLAQAGLLLEQFRPRIMEESSRNSFFSRDREFYDAAINFKIERKGEIAEAFGLAENARARSLLEARQFGTQVLKSDQGAELKLASLARPFSLPEIQRRMSPNTQIIEYAVLPDQVVAWVITSQSCVLAKASISAPQLQERVEKFVRLLSAPRALTREVKSQAGELYAILIQPLEPYLNRQAFLCFVPDEALNSLPFAALYSPATGRFLVEDYCLMMSPSATVFVACAEAERRQPVRATERLLSIGNSELAKGYAETLPELSAAREEAQNIAAFYSNAEVLVEGQATESRFRQQARQAEVIHFAGHALIDERVPLLSKLLLAPDAAGNDQGDGILYAYELYQMAFPRARLVVLSACQTGRGRNYSGEGVMNLSRPFISAGVSVVVASLWNVESKETAELMKAFHRARRQTLGRAPEALRQAQLASLKNTSAVEAPAFTWAAFTSVGGVN